MKYLFKKIILTNVIVLTLFLNACGAGSVSSNDLSTSSIDQSYLNLKIVGNETTYPSIDLEMVAFFSLYGFNDSSICLDPNPYIHLASTDSLSVNMNSNIYLFHRNTCKYVADIGSINLPESYEKQITLNYKSYNFLAKLPNFPQVYTIESATCTNQGNNFSCNVTTNRPVGEIYSVGSPYYITDYCGSSIFSDATVENNGHDIFNFTAQCNKISNPSITLVIDTNPVRVNPVTNYESGDINMQYSFMFFSKTINGKMQ
ncbi:MAG: hypothetical protein ACK5Z5_00665 [Neisseriaceae bacterium]|jgi:hypothetical protein